VIAALWGLFLPAAIILIGLRLRRSWLWIGFSVVEIAVHSAIPHKEYRFVYPAFAALIVVAALGSADVLVRVGSRLRSIRPELLTAVMGGAWLLTSLTLAASPQFRPEWTVSRGILQGEFWLARRSDLCGVLFYDAAWFETGGYAFLHRRVPLYFPVYAMRLAAGNRLVWPEDMALRRGQARRAADAYNYVVLKPGSVANFQPEFTQVGCFGIGAERACVAERPGGCSSGPALSPILAVPGLGEPATRP
jgi:hypothetical protein